MKTVQMTVEKELSKSVDRVGIQLRTARSAFPGGALRDAVTKYDAISSFRD
jgi:hypothetical protein